MSLQEFNERDDSGKVQLPSTEEVRFSEEGVEFVVEGDSYGNGTLLVTTE